MFVQRAEGDPRRKAVARLNQLSIAPPATGTTLDMLRDLRSATGVDVS